MPELPVRRVAVPWCPGAGSAVRVLGAALVAGAILAACGGGSPGGRPAVAPPPRVPPVVLRPGSVEVVPTGAPGTLGDTERDAVLAAVATYLDEATLRPLAGRRPRLRVIDPGLRSSLDAGQRDAALDGGLPRATGRVRVRAAPVPLVALLDPEGAVAIVGAALDVTVQAPTRLGPVAVHRRGELVLSPADEGWQVTSFRFEVNREVPGTGRGGPAGRAGAGSR